LVSLKNILTHILQAHDFEVYEKDGVLRGEKDGAIVTVGLYDNITVKEIRAHAGYVSHEQGNHIICVLEANETAEEEARALGLTIWKRSDLETELGMAITDQIRTGNTIFKGLLEQPQAPIESHPLIIENLGTEGQPNVLKTHLTLDDVKEIAKNTIQGFKYELEFVPHYIFNYSCSYEGKDGQTVQRSGTISVNALTGKFSEWVHQPEVDTETEHVIQLEPKIDQDNAEKIAFHAIITLNTEYKEIIIERDHATIMERATYKPEMGAIVLEHQVIVMVPVWCAEGKHGVMILDGITGKVISEDYYDSH